MYNRNSVTTLLSRDSTWPAKVHIVKAMVFPLVMYGCESWTIKKKEKESEVAQSYPTLCNPMAPPSVHRIFQARVLE